MSISSPALPSDVELVRQIGRDGLRDAIHTASSLAVLREVAGFLDIAVVTFNSGGRLGNFCEQRGVRLQDNSPETLEANVNKFVLASVATLATISAATLAS